MSQQSNGQSLPVITELLNGVLQPLSNSTKVQPHQFPALRTQTREIEESQMEPEHRGDTLELVSFQLKGEFYAIEARYVYEVMQPPEITIIPHTPDFLQGVINLRGEIFAVFDFNQLFGLGRSTIEDASRLIVLGNSHPQFAFVADAAEEVKTIHISELSLLTAPFASIRKEIVRGVTADALVILDGQELL